MKSHPPAMKAARISMILFFLKLLKKARNEDCEFMLPL
jgi:hypothetical protein